MKQDRTGCHSGKKRITGIVVLLLISAYRIYGSENNEYVAFKEQSLGPTQVRYVEIVKQYPDNPQLLQFQKRVALLDKVTQRIIQNFEQAKLQSLQKFLPGITPPVSKKPGSVISTISAADLIVQYGNAFAEPLPIPDIPESELLVLKEYYGKTAAACREFITKRGCMVVVAIDAGQGEQINWFLVIPFLHIGDANWTRQDVLDLPEPVRQPDDLTVMENFSLRINRPLTAYQFYVYHEAVQSQPKTFERLDYFLDRAGKLFEWKYHRAGITCLEAGLKLSQDEKNNTAAVQYHLKLAEALHDIGQIKMAVYHASQILDHYPESEIYAKAALMRLKYLYETDQFEDIIQESPQYQADSRCQSCLPQIVYISWITHRRKGLNDESQKLQDWFLEKYPENPLGADMYFTSAMSELASGNYAKALQALDYIEYHYPDSQIIEKVKDLQARLKNRQM